MLLLSISHDIKTPLNTIKLYVKALLEEVYDNEVLKKEAVGQIGEKAGEIELFVKEIVQASTHDIIDITVENGEFYLDNLMSNIRKTYKERCENQNITFTIDTVLDCLLRGDLDRGIEVCENIMENALKYGDGNQIHIYFYEEDYCQLVCFRNTGILVPRQERLHLFDSFYRASNAVGKEGSGLGLYICKEIMKKMDGDVFAREWEEGMEFVVVFR